MSRAYYNEIDPYAAQWLRNLIAAGHIAPGDVDERSITDVQPDDLTFYDQCHFFAGIGGWSLALRLARWPDSRKIWTGSCPCQPFSLIGKGLGTADERHLWPVLRALIGKRRPPVVVGEQVAGAPALLWLSGVFSDLEGMGYAAGASDLCAASVGAPHIRQRFIWLGDANDARLEGYARDGDSQKQSSSARPVSAPSCAVPWNSFVRITDRLGNTRRCESGTSPMAARLSSHMGRLRAYGNAIVPQVAAEVIAAYMECRP